MWSRPGAHSSCESVRPRRANISKGFVGLHGFDGFAASYCVNECVYVRERGELERWSEGESVCVQV